MNLLKRLFKIGEAEANSALNKIEDPIKLTEQGIRDLKKDLGKSLESLAEIKGMAIRSQNDLAQYRAKSEDYQQKAMLILKKGQTGELDSTEADRLATKALEKKEENDQQAQRCESESERFDVSVKQLEKNIDEIKKNISRWENELRTLKARHKVAKATKNLNKQMANIDSTSTVSMLERMKEKVAQDEAVAQAYGDVANVPKSIDDEINKAASTTSGKASTDLAKLKEQLGIDKKPTS